MCRCCRPTLPCPLCLGWCGSASLEHGQGPAYLVTSRQVGTTHSMAGRVARVLDVPGARPLDPPCWHCPAQGLWRRNSHPCQQPCCGAEPDVPKCLFSHRHEWWNLCGLLGAGDGRCARFSLHLPMWEGIFLSAPSWSRLAAGVEMGHSRALLGFPCGVSLLGTEAGPPWGWRLVFAALGCLLLSHPGRGPEGTE